jgi:hypothetical protein
MKSMWIALAAIVAVSGLPIQIFPAWMNGNGFEELSKTYMSQPELFACWTNLKGGFDSFEKDHRLTAVRVGKDDRYEFVR